MKYIYAIKDTIANELIGMRMYLLMVFRTDQEAARYFADAINDKSSILNKHPADYQLLCIGMLTATDDLVATDAPRLIITGEVLLAMQSNKQADGDDDADVTHFQGQSIPVPRRTK